MEYISKFLFVLLFKENYDLFEILLKDKHFLSFYVTHALPPILNFANDIGISEPKFL